MKKLALLSVVLLAVGCGSTKQYLTACGHKPESKAGANADDLQQERGAIFW